MPNRAGKPIRIQLVEDQELVRSIFRSLLNDEKSMEVVAESATGELACRDYESYRPDVVIMPLFLPDMSGLELTRRILGRYPEARILFQSMYSGIVTEIALKLGVRGFVSRQCCVRDLITAIRQIMRDEYFVDPESANQLARRIGEMGADLLPYLSRRELEIGRLLANGRSVSSIAAQMHVSASMIYAYRKRVLRKLGVTSVAALMQIPFILDIANVQSWPDQDSPLSAEAV